MKLLLGLLSLKFLSAIEDDTEYTWHNGIDYHNLDNNSTISPRFSSGIEDVNLTDRNTENVKSMLTSLACFGVPGKCTVNSKLYYKALRNYGCNCYPSNYDRRNVFTREMEYHFGGNGQAIDELDNACREAYSNYKCFTSDLNNNKFKSFKADEQPHNACHKGIKFHYHMGKNGAIICGRRSDPGYAANRSENVCRRIACMVERNFAYTAFKILGKDPSLFKAENLNSYNLGQNGKCSRAPGNSRRDFCCGNYPMRFPYDIDRNDCCNGEITSLGSC